MTAAAEMTEHERRSLARRTAPAQRLELMSRREDGCLIWTGALDDDGYGKTRVGNGPAVRVHRLAWTLANGPIPPGMVVRHRCDNPPCIDVAHLKLGTTADNNRDRAERGRSCTGERHHSARLTLEQAAAIRSRTRAGESVVAVAREYGVRPWSVQKIRDGLSWRSAG